MTWQYRVMNISGQHAIHEVYYYGEDSSLLKGYSVHPAYPHGDSLEELIGDLCLYKEALDFPVLTPDDFSR